MANEHEWDARIAREIQQKLLPRVPRLGGFDIGAASHPLNSAAGDFFDFFPMLDGSLGIVVGDVAGHGVGPALLMATTRAYLRALARTHSDIGQILTLVNEMLSEDVGERFVTLFFGLLDHERRSLTFANAGHGMCYILDGSGGMKSLDCVAGLLLGVAPAHDYSVSSPIELARGDIVFLPSDGLVEGYFGMNPVIDIIRSSRCRRAQDIIGILFAAVRFFYPAARGETLAPKTGDAAAIEEVLKALEKYDDLTPIPDDMTCVLIKVE
jgi:sigma-B regulation protein RsbU (phosphoserine phosphatase)